MTQGVIFEMIVNSISQGENIKTKSEPCLIPLQEIIMQSIIFFIVFMVIFVDSSFAVRCDVGNPCQLGGDFSPPNYQCLEPIDSPNNVVCTCPDGQTVVNNRCRICETVNCGPTGICIERSFFENFFYACGCKNGSYNYLNPGPCPDANPTTTTSSPGICLNGGTYNLLTSTCICPSGFTGSICEISIGLYNCVNVTCTNGGVCNPIPSTINGIEMQCICPDGFSGANCELIGINGRCTSNLCQNNGVCEEKLTGTAVYAYCRCSPGFIGQSCQTSYFTCPAPGLYADPIHCKFGRYFQCVGSTLTSLTCPRGLRYNFMKMRCDSDVTCPP